MWVIFLFHCTSCILTRPCCNIYTTASRCPITDGVVTVYSWCLIVTIRWCLVYMYLEPLLNLTCFRFHLTIYLAPYYNLTFKHMRYYCVPKISILLLKMTFKFSTKFPFTFLYSALYTYGCVPLFPSTQLLLMAIPHVLIFLDTLVCPL